MTQNMITLQNLTITTSIVLKEEYGQDYSTHMFARAIKQDEIMYQWYTDKLTEVEDKKFNLINTHYPDQEITYQGLLTKEWVQNGMSQSTQILEGQEA